MFLYISFSLGKFYDCVKSNFMLSLFGIISIIGSVFLGYAICGFIEVKASLISLEVIPFLILAIGVDNMFLIYDQVMKVPSADPLIKVPVGLRNCGISITLSTFTIILTFMSGFYTGIPALETFCRTAVYSLLINFIVQTSVWPALLAIDLKRKQLGYLDLIPFIKTKRKVDIKFREKSWVSNFFKNYWSKLVLSIPCKIFSFFICFGLFGLFFFAMKDISEGLD